MSGAVYRASIRVVTREVPDGVQLTVLQPCSTMEEILSGAYQERNARRPVEAFLAEIQRVTQRRPA